jgi:hypothetical protein
MDNMTKPGTGNRHPAPLTADTITDTQIRALQADAGESGDSEMYDICRLALGLTPAMSWPFETYGARSRCADVINNARAMDEDEDEENPNDAESARRDRGLPARDGTVRS